MAITCVLFFLFSLHSIIYRFSAPKLVKLYNFNILSHNALARTHTLYHTVRSYKTKTEGLLEYYKSRQPFPGSRARSDAFVLFGEVSLKEILTSYYVFEN